MPSNILTTDTSFPRLTEEQSTDEKFGVVTNYLYMLLEQLRYSMANLGRENFNDAEFDSIANTITEPVFIRIEDVEGNVSSLQVTAQQLTARMEDAEGNISSLQLTAKSLTSRITDAEGNISTLQQTSNSLMARVQDAEGNISSLQLTAQSLTTRIANAEGEVSSLTQTVNSITLTVSNGEYSSTIRLLMNGIIMSSRTIQFTGMVTFADLEGSGTTIINGDNIQTGTISAIDIYGCTIEGSVFRSVLDYNGDSGGEIQFYYLSTRYLAGGIRLDDQGAGTQYENRYRMFVYTESVAGVAFAMKLQAAGGISIEADENVYIEARTRLTVDGDIVTIRGGSVNIDGDVYINGDLYTPAG